MLVLVILQLLIGAAALLLGRQLFWFFVGAVGFLIGLSFAPVWFGQLPTWALWIVGVGLGVVFAVLAVFIQKPMASLAGFFAGGFLILGLFQLFAGNALASNQLGWLNWVVFVIAGIIGAVLVFIAFDWALIIISVLFGTHLIMKAIDPVSNAPFLIATILYCLIALTGFWVQSKQLAQTTSTSTSRLAGT